MSEFREGRRTTGEVRSYSAFSSGDTRRSAPTYVSLGSIAEDSLVANPRPLRRLTGPDGTAWVCNRPAATSLEADALRRGLNTKITYICEAAAKQSDREPWDYAGVPESMFRRWQRNRALVYWPPDDVDKAIEKRMALDGYTLANPRAEDLLTTLGEAALAGYRLYTLAHGLGPLG